MNDGMPTHRPVEPQRRRSSKPPIRSVVVAFSSRLKRLSIHGKSRGPTSSSADFPANHSPWNPLLELPREIRDQIYSEFVNLWHISVEYHSKKLTRVHDQSEYVRNIRLFHMNQQIRNEAIEYMKSTRVDFEFGVRHLTPGSTSPGVSPTTRTSTYHAIPDLFLANMTDVYSYPFAPGNQNHARTLQVPKFLALQTFTFHFDSSMERLPWRTDLNRTTEGQALEFERGALDDILVQDAWQICLEPSRTETVYKWAASVWYNPARTYKVLLAGLVRETRTDDTGSRCHIFVSIVSWYLNCCFGLSESL